MPILNLDVINKMRKAPSFECLSTGPSNYKKGVVLKAVFENGLVSRAQIKVATCFSYAVIVECLNSLEDSGLVTHRSSPIMGTSRVCYSVANEEGDFEVVQKAMDRAPKQEAETQGEKALRRIPKEIKRGNATKKLLIKAISTTPSVIDGALKELIKSNVIFKTKSTSKARTKSALAYSLVS